MQFCREEKALQRVDAGQWTVKPRVLPCQEKMAERSRLAANRRQHDPVRVTLHPEGPAGGFGGEEARLGPPGQDDKTRSDSDRGSIGGCVLLAGCERGAPS